MDVAVARLKGTISLVKEELASLQKSLSEEVEKRRHSEAAFSHLKDVSQTARTWSMFFFSFGSTRLFSSQDLAKALPVELHWLI